MQNDSPAISHEHIDLTNVTVENSVVGGILRAGSRIAMGTSLATFATMAAVWLAGMGTGILPAVLLASAVIGTGINLARIGNAYLRNEGLVSRAQDELVSDINSKKKFDTADLGAMVMLPDEKAEKLSNAYQMIRLYGQQAMLEQNGPENTLHALQDKLKNMPARIGQSEIEAEQSKRDARLAGHGGGEFSDVMTKKLGLSSPEPVLGPERDSETKRNTWMGLSATIPAAFMGGSGVGMAINQGTFLAKYCHQLTLAAQGISLAAAESIDTDKVGLPNAAESFGRQGPKHGAASSNGAAKPLSVPA